MPSHGLPVSQSAAVRPTAGFSPAESLPAPALASPPGVPACSLRWDGRAKSDPLSPGPCWLALFLLRPLLCQPCAPSTVGPRDPAAARQGRGSWLDRGHTCAETRSLWGALASPAGLQGGLRQLGPLRPAGGRRCRNWARVVWWGRPWPGRVWEGVGPCGCLVFLWQALHSTLSLPA